MDGSILVSLISAVSGITIAYIVNIASKRVQKTRRREHPKDRMEQMFDGYERLIKQKDSEDDRKSRLIADLEAELLVTRRMVAKLEQSIEMTQKELVLSREENQELREMLKKMRDEYHEKKKKEQHGV